MPFEAEFYPDVAIFKASLPFQTLSMGRIVTIIGTRPEIMKILDEQ